MGLWVYAETAASAVLEVVKQRPAIGHCLRLFGFLLTAEPREKSRRSDRRGRPLAGQDSLQYRPLRRFSSREGRFQPGLVRDGFPPPLGSSDDCS